MATKIALVFHRDGMVVEWEVSQWCSSSARYAFGELRHYLRSYDGTIPASVYVNGVHVSTYAEHNGRIFRTVPNVCKVRDVTSCFVR